MERTVGDSLDVPPPSNKIRAHNANIDRHRYNASPPPDDIPNKVDLLLGLRLRPEAYARDEERPVDRQARVRVARRKPSVVLQHQALQLEELLEEVH